MLNPKAFHMVPMSDYQMQDPFVLILALVTLLIALDDQVYESAITLEALLYALRVVSEALFPAEVFVEEVHTSEIARDDIGLRVEVRSSNHQIRKVIPSVELFRHPLTEVMVHPKLGDAKLPGNGCACHECANERGALDENLIELMGLEVLFKEMPSLCSLLDT